MHYLIDTHVLIWWITADNRLSDRAKSLVRSHRNEIYWSVASSWEISIKCSLGKLLFEEPPETLLPMELDRNRIETLPILNEHAFKAGQLPFYHKDPFDRMLIAQASVESMGLISDDLNFQSYEVDVFW
jgi:PIN domain nuclease of toxin-antitoxin system